MLQRVVACIGRLSSFSSSAQLPNSFKGVKTLSVVISSLLQSRALDAAASAAITDLLLNEAGRRIFCVALEDALASAPADLIPVESGPFLHLSGLINSLLTGMELDRELDMQVMDGVRKLSRRVGRGGADPMTTEFLLDSISLHSIWSVQRFWDSAFFNQVTSEFSSRFGGATLANTTMTDVEQTFVCQQLVAFAVDMVRWRRPLEEAKAFLKRNADVLQLGPINGDAIQKEVKRVKERTRAARHATVLSEKTINLLQGWLFKKGDKGLVRSLKKRYFKQVGHQLLYFEQKGKSYL